MKYYKLTDRNGQSYGGTQWEKGITHKTKGMGVKFCSADLIHITASSGLAVIMNPIHANFTEPLLWEVEAEIVASNRGLKLGAKEVTTIRQVPLPEISTEQRVRLAIFCALEVYPEKGFFIWAQKWLSDKDRTKTTAWMAALAAKGAAAWAAWAAVWAAEGAVKTVALMAALAVACAAERTAEGKPLGLRNLVKKAILG